MRALAAVVDDGCFAGWQDGLFNIDQLQRFGIVNQNRVRLTPVLQIQREERRVQQILKNIVGPAAVLHAYQDIALAGRNAFFGNSCVDFGTVRLSVQLTVMQHGRVRKPAENSRTTADSPAAAPYKKR